MKNTKVKFTKTVIAVWNRGSKGKTSSLRELAHQLIINYPRCQKILPNPFSIKVRGDFKMVIKIKNTIIGIVSQGDPQTGLKGKLKEMQQFKCDLIFCATRMKGNTVVAVEEMYHNHGYEVIWTSTYEHHTKPVQDALNQIKGGHLLDLSLQLGLIN